MQRWLLLFSLIVGLLVSSLAQSAGLDQLKAFLKANQTAQGAFTQSVINKNGRKGQQSAGSFAFARGGKFRWIYEKPYAQILVSDGNKMWSYDPELKQVTVRKAGNALGSSPAALLAGGELEQNFNLQEAGVVAGQSYVEATPKAKDSSFNRVKIGMVEGKPQSMEIHDNFGQTTLLMFQNFEANRSLAPSLFTFVPPKGVDVLQSD